MASKTLLALLCVLAASLLVTQEVVAARALLADANGKLGDKSSEDAYVHRRLMQEVPSYGYGPAYPTYPPGRPPRGN